MSCENNWSFKFPETGFEIRPVSMDLKLSRHEYDFCRAQFFYSVGEEMKPHTSNGGVLDKMTPVDVLYNGNPIKRLLFRPDWVTYNERRTEIEFHDFHKALSAARVDIQRFKIQLKDIYKEVVNGNGGGIIPEIDDSNFQLTENQVRTLYGNIPPGLEHEEGVDTDETKKALESTYAVDFDNITAEKAVARLNKKFGLRSWSNETGELIIGVPEERNIRHVAADSDPRVWKYESPSMNHGREPIKRVLVKGPWIEEPGIGGPGDAFGEVKSWFTQNKQGSADVRAYGIAERTDIDYGTIVTTEATKAKKDSLPTVAMLAFKEEMKNQNAGTVEINTSHSGTQVSDPIDMKPGDTLQLVPPDDNFDNPTAESGGLLDKPARDQTCGAYVYNESYIISGVEHNVTDSGTWEVRANVSLRPDVPLSSGLAYYNPSEDGWVEDSEIASDGDLKGGWHDIENL